MKKKFLVLELTNVRDLLLMVCEADNLQELYDRYHVDKTGKVLIYNRGIPLLDEHNNPVYDSTNNKRVIIIKEIPEGPYENGFVTLGFYVE
jgi:hypothetical protein